jgi:NAD(P)H-hydrate repair Nnr-like enzyme with NAD(P)H-hydrate dehydratase domain
VKYPTALHEDDMEEEGVIDNIMIYPIGEKYTTTTPYLEILSRFRKTLINEQVVIVIGFSFRDNPINNAFVDRVVKFNTRFKNFKIVLVDPDAINITQTLPLVLRSKITPVSMEFGNQNCVDSIVNAIQERHPGDL